MNSLYILAGLISQRISPRSVEDSQWGAIVETAVRHDLAPMLYWVTKDEVFNLKSDPCILPLKQAANETAAKFSLFELTRAQIDSAMSNAGIPTIWLKGIALAYTIYPQPWLRPMGDIDVIVLENQRKLALITAESLGYLPSSKPKSRPIEIPDELHHHYKLYGSVANSVCLELHYKLFGMHGYGLHSQEQLDWFWQNSSDIAFDGKEITTFNPEAQLLHLSAHALLLHGEKSTSLLRHLDTHLLITETVLDWDLTVNKALEFMWALALERALTLAINYFDTPVPEWVLNQLQKKRSINENSDRVHKLQDREFQLERKMMLLSEMSHNDRIRSVIKYIFPSKAYMRGRYSIPSAKAVLPYYFYRWFDGGRQLFWSIRSRVAKLIYGNR